MSIPELGKLSVVGLREAWQHEAHNFTPWLALHLEELAAVIGVPLELVDKEVSVDTFFADILARNPQDDSLVLIENQLEVTDHNHLGQIMTYLAGLEVQTIVWIAADFREAHLSALNWLNEHTKDPFSFFAVKVKAVRIADSPVAPVFEVVAKPNHWERQLQSLSQDKQQISRISQFRKDFWSHYLMRHPKPNEKEATFQSNRWIELEDLNLIISYYIAQQYVGIFVRGPRKSDASDTYAFLKPHEAFLTEELGVELGNPEGVHFLGDYIKANTSDKQQWDVLADWLHEKTKLYQAVFADLEM